MEVDDALALLALIETLGALLRASSELGSSIPTTDPRVIDLVRLVGLAGDSAGKIERRASALFAALTASPSVAAPTAALVGELRRAT
jgi:hypothetical protein